MIAGCVFTVLVALLLPVAALAVLKRRTGRGLAAALVGAVCFIVFALVLEQMLHAVVFGLYPAISLYSAVYAAYGCLAAGLFEETGRVLGLWLVCRKDAGMPSGWGYGIGHGGAEAILLVGINAAVSLAALLGVPALSQVTGALEAAGASAFWAAGVERLAAMALHTALSLLIWMVVTRRLPAWGYAVSVLLHALANVPAALAQTGVLRGIWGTEALIAVAAALVCLVVFLLYRRTGAARRAA